MWAITRDFEWKVENKAGRGGRVEAMVNAVLRVLARRGLEVRAEERERIVGERDLARLEAWLDAALTCASASELLR